jgi:hypothetical protein
VISFVWDDPLRARSAAELQNFFSESFRKNERVLNLCRNSDVFFKEGFIKPAARAFVSWSNILQVKDLRNSMLESNPDAILTCPINDVPNLQASMEAEQEKLLETIYPKRVLVKSYSDALGAQWKVYRAVP